MVTIYESANARAVQVVAFLLDIESLAEAAAVPERIARRRRLQPSVHDPLVLVRTPIRVIILRRRGDGRVRRRRAERGRRRGRRPGIRRHPVEQSFSDAARAVDVVVVLAVATTCTGGRGGGGEEEEEDGGVVIM
ncbi:hypothetical protein DM860_005072 [Cuscuta australis]|uniref:Uncharacterized protein n=1 Tax=Cuscuta australis TaxID=267555 RepID=A0A328DS49_9ASTE|nr:hypothetical protein DM860_005072 [Cuscuta australis]